MITKNFEGVEVKADAKTLKVFWMSDWTRVTELWNKLYLMRDAGNRITQLATYGHVNFYLLSA